jgi:dsRNA-specific ribonuclease
VLEQIGDASGGKFLIDYFYKKFKQLNCPEGVKVTARLKINYGSKNSFAQIAQECNMWDFISARFEDRATNKKSLSEDVFEAVLGKIEILINNAWGNENGYGYGCVYSILENIFNQKVISLKYEDLYDPKTRLKELFDDKSFKNRISDLNYQEIPNTLNNLTKIGVYCKLNSRIIQIGTGSAPLKKDAEQAGAKVALQYLENINIFKPIPEIYNKLSLNQEKETTLQEISSKYPNINDTILFEKLNQNLFYCTPLSLYCSNRDIQGVQACLTLRANVDVRDTDKMSPIERVVVGSLDIVKVGTIIKKLIKTKQPCRMRKDIFDNYFKLYLSPTNVKNIKNLKKFQELGNEIIVEN